MIYGVDLYEDALRVATCNIEEFQAGKKIQLLQGDLFNPLLNTPVDVLLLNLPFASRQKITAIAQETSSLDEPLYTIFVGQTGFELYEKLFKQLETYQFMNSIQGIWLFCAREHLVKVSRYHEQQFSRFKLRIFDNQYKKHFIHYLLY